MSSKSLYFVLVLSLVASVRAKNSEGDQDVQGTKTTSKRGVRGLAGIPGVLYSQYSPHVRTVPVPQPFPVPVPHPVPVHVPRPFPVTVHKPVGLPVPVGVPFPVSVPVPKPYPVPVPVNLPHGPSGMGFGNPFGASAYGAHLEDYAGAFSHLGGSDPGYSGRFGYGLGIYGSGTPSLPMAHPGLAAALASLASAHQAHPGAPEPHIDPLSHHQPKY